MSEVAHTSMDRTAYLDYFEEMGRHPLEASNLVWFESGPGFYQSFPFHVTAPDGLSLPTLFARPRVLAARFPRLPSGEDRRRRSALWIRREAYGLDRLSSNARSKVRRGLKKTRVERIDFPTLAQRGLPLVASTSVRQRMRFGARQEASWRRLCDTARHHPMMEVWGGFVDDAMAIFAICFQVEDCFQISTVRSDTELLGAYPNNALIHTLMEEGFSRPGVECVCYGLASLDRGTGGLNDFKRGAGFDAEEIDDVIVGRLPIVAARAGGAVLERVASRSHRMAQLATISRTVGWWRREPS